MPVHKCGSSVLCLHELGSSGGAGTREDDASDFEYLEVDPSGRYGRVIIHHYHHTSSSSLSACFFNYTN